MTFFQFCLKEVTALIHEREKLERFLGGIKDMTSLPDILFVVDPKKEYIAVNEAHILGIPVIGIVDTNCDPDEVDYPIPGNDDAIRAVKLLTSTIANAVIEGNQGHQYEESSEDLAYDENEENIEDIAAEETNNELEETEETEEA